MLQPSSRSSSTIMEYTNQIELLYATWAEMIRVDLFNEYNSTGYLQVHDTNPHGYLGEDWWGLITDLGPLQPSYRHARFAGYQPTSEDDASSDYSSTAASTNSTTDLDMPALMRPDTPVVRKRSTSLECRPRHEGLTPHQTFRFQNRHRATSA